MTALPHYPNANDFYCWIGMSRQFYRALSVYVYIFMHFCQIKIVKTFLNQMQWMNNMHADDKLSISLLKIDSERFWIEKKNYVTRNQWNIRLHWNFSYVVDELSFFPTSISHLFWEFFPLRHRHFKVFLFICYIKRMLFFNLIEMKMCFYTTFFFWWFKSNLFHVSFKAIAIPFRFPKADCIEMARKCILPIW